MSFRKLTTLELQPKSNAAAKNEAMGIDLFANMAVTPFVVSSGIASTCVHARNIVNGYGHIHTYQCLHTSRQLPNDKLIFLRISSAFLPRPKAVMHSTIIENI